MRRNRSPGEDAELEALDRRHLERFGVKLRSAW
jgi:hypothetical protein